MKSKINTFLRKHGSILFAMITLTVVVFIAINGFLFINSLNDHVSSMSREQLEEVSSDLRAALSDAEITLVKIAAEVSFMKTSGYTDAQLAEALKGYQNKIQDKAIDIYIVDGNKIISGNYQVPADYDLEAQDWYIGASKEEIGKSYISAPYKCDITGQNCFTVALRSYEGVIICADCKLDRAQNIVSGISNVDGSESIIIGDDGLVVACSDEANIGVNVVESLPEYNEVLKKISTSGESLASFESKINGRNSMVYYNKIGNGWYIISSVSKMSLYKNNYRLLIINLYVTVILLVVLAALYHITHKRRNQVEDTLIAEEKFLNTKTELVSQKVHAILKQSSESRLDDTDIPAAMTSISESASKIDEVMTEIMLSAKVIETVQEENKSEEDYEFVQKGGINRKVFVAILVIMVLLFAITLVVTSITVRSRGREEMMYSATEYANQLKLWATDQKGTMDMLVSYISVNPEILDDYDYAVDWLSAVVDNDDDISSAYIANPDSYFKTIVSGGWVPSDDMIIEDRPWYDASYKSKDDEGFAVTGPYYDFKTGSYCVTLSEKVYDTEGNYLGVFGMDYYLDELEDIISMEDDNNGYAFLADKDGVIIVHPNEEYKLRTSKSTTLEETGYIDIVYADKPKGFKDYDGKSKLGVNVVDDMTGLNVIVVRKWTDVYGDVIKYDILFTILFGITIFSVARIIITLFKWQEKANKILQESVEAATQADEAKSQFLAQMSHEIRTPINAVLGMDEMILRESNNESVRSYARDIQSAGNSLLSIINDILDISKIESGKLEIVPAEYELVTILRDLVNMVSFRANAKNLKLEVEVDKNLPSKLFGDDVRVKQCITNILTNAAKYTQQGTIWFRVSGTVKDKILELYVEVEDTGIGIKEEDLSKLFSAFDRIEEKRNRNIEGTGLGMNITQNLLHLMGSKLEVESTYGVGSKFYFTLQQEIRDSKPIGEFSEAAKEEDNYDYQESFYAPNARILVVDDNSLNRKVFIALLKSTGAQITEAESGKECLELTEKNYYDIIFLDHMMPELDGIETLHLMKKNLQGPNKNTPVFVLTANAVTGAKEMYLSEGFNGFLSKPVVAAKLEEVIKENISPRLFQDAPDKAEVEKKEKLAKAAEEDMGELPIIGGVDWNYALAHLYEKDLVISTVKDFVNLVPHHADKLEEMYQKFKSSGSLEGYRIQVHSMKSVAATLGIIPLAGMANVLEYAARDGVAETVTNMHAIFLDYWNIYGERLRESFGIEEVTMTKEEYDIYSVTDQLEQLKEAMEDLDIDTADPIVDYLYKYNWGEEINAKIKELKNAVTALDSDAVAELVDEILSSKE